MQVLINLSKDEINALGQITKIRDENDIVFCLHELVERITAKKPDNIQDKYSPNHGEIRVGMCPSCRELISDILGICQNCGQRILWEVPLNEK